MIDEAEHAAIVAGVRPASPGWVLLARSGSRFADRGRSARRRHDLTNHLTKRSRGPVDPASIQYVDRVLGEAEVDTRSHSAAERISGGSDQFSTTRVPLAPAHVLRQMRPGDALLVHGTLPPAHVRTRPFYRNRHLAKRAATAAGEEGRTA